MLWENLGQIINNVLLTLQISEGLKQIQNFDYSYDDAILSFDKQGPTTVAGDSSIPEPEPENPKPIISSDNSDL